MLHSYYHIFLAAKERIYDKYDFSCSHFQAEAESKAYEACRFKLNDLQVIHRAARTTPKKRGQFVVLWKRNAAGITVPLDMSDAFDFIAISARDREFFGQFIFPKGVLEARGIVSSVKEGKRGIRLYPPWENDLNKQAQKTQQWQSAYFLNVPPIGSEAVDIDKVKALFEIR